MSKFEKKLNSKIRMSELEEEFIRSIAKFSINNPEITVSEVNSVMLRMLTQANDDEMKNEQ